ncbi:MAG: type II secretory pathway pseudopilin PulG [Planctomycetota bacterium]|jgi:type II secretory pathway pseudopilin PulG
MKRWTESGFTLVEWCVLVVCVSLMAACALPMAASANHAANASLDTLQLRTHFTWMEIYKRVHRVALPSKGGHKFVLSTWTGKIFDHTPENFDLFFSPGARERDSHYFSMRGVMEKGEEPWPDIASVTSEDTHYVGRAHEHLPTAMGSARDAWIATDNEGQWTFADGHVNVLFNGGNVRSYAYEDLAQRFGLGPLQIDKPILTHGPDSPIPECQKLGN